MKNAKEQFEKLENFNDYLIKLKNEDENVIAVYHPNMSYNAISIFGAKDQNEEHFEIPFSWCPFYNEWKCKHIDIRKIEKIINQERMGVVKDFIQTEISQESLVAEKDQTEWINWEVISTVSLTIAAIMMSIISLL
jgi:hypothetical protein